MRSAVAAVAVASLLLLATTGCAPTRIDSVPESSRSEEATPPLPPPLAAGEPQQLEWASPNMMTREERYRRFVLQNERHATLDDAESAMGFPLALPAETAGHKLEYLLTTPDDSSSMPVFSAHYDANVLQIAVWLGPSLLQDPGSLYSANSTIHGLPASVIETLSGSRMDKAMQADLAWSDGDFNYHLWYDGPVEEARRIAESIPLR